MAGTSLDCYKTFFRQIQNGNWTLKNIREAYTKGYIVQRDLEQTYNAVFLQSVIAFELLIEEIFFNLLIENITHPRGSEPWQVFPDMDVARRIVLQGKNYIDWLPIERLNEKAEVFFRPSGNPFSALTPSEKTELKNILTIRNFIAHRSEYSTRMYNQRIVGAILLPRGPRKLLNYFLYTHTTSVTKYEYHISQLNNAARTIST